MNVGINVDKDPSNKKSIKLQRDEVKTTMKERVKWWDNGNKLRLVHVGGHKETKDTKRQRTHTQKRYKTLMYVHSEANQPLLGGNLKTGLKSFKSSDVVFYTNVLQTCPAGHNWWTIWVLCLQRVFELNRSASINGRSVWTRIRLLGLKSISFRDENSPRCHRDSS